MAGASCAIRGSFFDFTDDPWKHIGAEQSITRFVADGLLVVKDGLIADFGSFADVSKRHQGLQVTNIKDRHILPGFIDGHIHFPQVRVLGAYGAQLLDWLTTWIFPEEEKYRDRDYSRTAAKHFFDDLLAGGTTTCLAFTTSSPVSTEEFFEEATRRNMRVIAGLTGIDRFAPEVACITPEFFEHESQKLIDRYHRKNRNLYAITPRFAVGCTAPMMESCHRLKQKNKDCWVNTHISENPSELRTAKVFFSDCDDYTHVHAKHGLLGPKFVAGHGLARTTNSAAFRRRRRLLSPSNLFLGRALPPGTGSIRTIRSAALGCDGRRHAFSMIRVLEEAYKVGMCNKTMTDGSVDPRQQDLAEAERNKLSPYRAFYLATLGGARAMYLDDMLGNFDKGKEADFVAIDWNGGQHAMRWHQSLICAEGGPKTTDQAAQLLFGVMSCGDDRNIDETWVAGKRAYKKGETVTA